MPRCANGPVGQGGICEKEKFVETLPDGAVKVSEGDVDCYRYSDVYYTSGVQDGAAGFHRQLVKGDLASEYDHEMRIWMEELEDMP